jgi:hypothetical protein
MDKISDTEDLFIMCNGLLPSILGGDMAIDKVRRLMKIISYHEAGHLAAMAFTNPYFSEPPLVTIIGAEDADWAGKVVGGPKKFLLEDLQRSGMKHLIVLLAGRGAEARVDAKYSPRILEKNALREAIQTKDGDIFCAWEMAEIMARSGLPARRVLAQAEKMTVDMLKMPDVWRCVETLAEKVLERGTLDDADEIRAVCSDITNSWTRWPQWDQYLRNAR